MWSIWRRSGWAAVFRSPAQCLGLAGVKARILIVVWWEFGESALTLLGGSHGGRRVRGDICLDTQGRSARVVTYAAVLF